MIEKSKLFRLMEHIIVQGVVLESVFSQDDIPAFCKNQKPAWTIKDISTTLREALRLGIIKKHGKYFCLTWQAKTWWEEECAKQMKQLNELKG